VRLADFDYELPDELIAQEPCDERDGSRLMVLAGPDGPPLDARFIDLPGLLRPGDLLVINDTRVRPSRLRGRRAAPGASARVEALLMEPRSGGERTQIWTALIKGAKGPGDPIDFGLRLSGRVVSREEEGFCTLEISTRLPDDRVGPALEETALMPTPPYIHRRDEDPRERIDRVRYQTVFARETGALAAPTAGLHFTQSVLEALRDSGVETAALTLHVGLGTFQPVREERIESHRMHSEWFRLGADCAEAVARARARAGRVIAVGTTVARTLEHCARCGGQSVEPAEGWCDLFILPGHEFRAVDGLLTNFHLPRSTLLMLVSAFAGRRRVLEAYHRAIELGYRFYSYGDAMLILP